MAPMTTEQLTATLGMSEEQLEEITLRLGKMSTEDQLTFLCSSMIVVLTMLEKFKPLLDKLDKRQKRGW